MLLNIIGFCLGTISILIASHYLILAASRLSQTMNWPESFTGIVILGLGTSLPEIFISIYSHWSNHDGMLIGNILGSNLTNILLIFGLGCLLLSSDQKIMLKQSWRHYGLLIALSAGLCFFVLIGILPRVVSLVLLLTAIVSFKQQHSYKPEDAKHEISWLKAIVEISAIILLIIFIIFSAKVIIVTGVNLSGALKIDEGVFAAIFVAISTSIPEIAVTIVAAYKKKFNLIVNTIIGSNIANIGFAVGISGLIEPIKATGPSLNFLAIMMLGSTIAFSLVIRKVHRAPKLIGLISLILYLVCIGVITQ